MTQTTPINRNDIYNQQKKLPPISIATQTEFEDVFIDTISDLSLIHI